MLRTMEDDNQTRITLRLPDDIRDHVAAQAKQNNRSMNAEIVARLQASDSSSRDDLLTIRGQALAIATLEFESSHYQTEVERLKVKLAMVARYLKSVPSEKPAPIVELIDEYASYAPAQSKFDELKTQMAEQFKEIKDALDDLEEVDPVPPVEAKALESPLETAAKTAVPQRQLRNNGRKALEAAAAREKVEIPGLPKVRRGASKAEKK